MFEFEKVRVVRRRLRTIMAVTALLSLVLVGCAQSAMDATPQRSDSSVASVSTVRSRLEPVEHGDSESREHGRLASGEHGGSASGEHGTGAEAGEHGNEGEEDSTQFELDDTYDAVRAGVRLILSFNRGDGTFTGTVENTTATTLRRVRVEVHLSNGTELGPTTPFDLAPGQLISITLSAAGESFATWSAHPEVG